MNILPTPIEGLVILEPRVFSDDRGYFFESHNATTFRQHGLDVAFVQDNVSRSSRGTLRGLHFQRAPHAQGKLVRVLEGNVFDVAVDLRKNSSTHRHWFGLELSGENKRALYIPPGFAHGFLTLSEHAVFTYKCTDVYHPECEAGVRWDDPTLAIDWPRTGLTVHLSPKDEKWPAVTSIESL